MFRNKWKSSLADCTPLIRRGTPINIQKIVSLFIILLCGFLCALITLFIETKYGHVLQSQLYSHEKTIINSKDKKMILLRQFKEDLNIGIPHSTLNIQLQDILNLHNKCQCCTCKCTCKCN